MERLLIETIFIHNFLGDTRMIPEGIHSSIPFLSIMNFHDNRLVISFLNVVVPQVAPTSWQLPSAMRGTFLSIF